MKRGEHDLQGLKEGEEEEGGGRRGRRGRRGGEGGGRWRDGRKMFKHTSKSSSRDQKRAHTQRNSVQPQCYLIDTNLLHGLQTTRLV